METIIVEDNKAYRKGLSMLLSRVYKENDIQIQEAENGLVFLEMIKYHYPTLVFMDIKMPEMGGIEATKIAKDKYPNLYIIAISSNDDYEVVMGMKEAGANAFMLKGFDGDTLVEAISKLLTSPNEFILVNQR